MMDFKKKKTLPCLIPRGQVEDFGEKNEFERVTKEGCDGFIGYLVNTDIHQALGKFFVPIPWISCDYTNSDDPGFGGNWTPQ